MHAPNIIRVILRMLLANRAALIAENLALRQQLAVLSRSAKRPRLRLRDRIFWVWISRLWTGWRNALVVVQPGTVPMGHDRGSANHASDHRIHCPGIAAMTLPAAIRPWRRCA